MFKQDFDSQITKKEENKIKSKFKKHFAQELKKARKSKKMSQEELAHEAGLHSAYLGHLETGKYMPTIFVVWKISRALDTRLQDLLKDF